MECGIFEVVRHRRLSGALSLVSAGVPVTGGRCHPFPVRPSPGQQATATRREGEGGGQRAQQRVAFKPANHNSYTKGAI